MHLRVFPSFVGGSVMPGITDFAVLEVATLIVDSGSGICFYASRSVSFLSSPGPDALQHGRYAPEGQLCCEMVIDIPFVLRRPIPMVQAVLHFLEFPQLRFDFFGGRSLLCGLCRFPGAVVEKTFVLPLLFQTAKTAESPQLQFIYGRRRSLRYADADSHGPAVDHGDSPVASHGGRRSCLQVEQVHFPVVAQRQVPWSKLFF